MNTRIDYTFLYSSKEETMNLYKDRHFNSAAADCQHDNYHQLLNSNNSIHLSLALPPYLVESQEQPC